MSSDPRGIEVMLAEARLMAFGDPDAKPHPIKPDERIMKSESGRLTMTLIIRVLEALASGQPQTPYSKRHHE